MNAHASGHVDQHLQNQEPVTEEQKAPVDFVVQRKNAMVERIKALGGPSEVQLNAWKSAAPGGRIRAFSLDDVRFYIVRAISGLELAEIWKSIPQNSTDPEKEAKILAATRCTLWTNSTTEKKLTEIALRTGPAGTPGSIWMLIEMISDFAEPADFQQCSVEL